MIDLKSLTQIDIEALNVYSRYFDYAVLIEALQDESSVAEVSATLKREVERRPDPLFFYNGKQLMYQSVANYLIASSYRACMVIDDASGDEALYTYRDGVFTADDRYLNTIVRKLVQRDDVNITSTALRNIRQCIEETDIIPHLKRTEARYIPLKNGIYDILERKLMPYNSNSNFVFLNKFPVRYIPDDERGGISSRVLNVVREIANDNEVFDLLLELIGYCFYTDTPHREGSIIMLTGEGSNGKSSLLNIIRQVIGSGNCSELSLDKLSDRFNRIEIRGMACNIGDDISGKPISESDFLKSIATGGVVTGERKGKDPEKFKPYAKLWFGMNRVPASYSDTSDGFLERFVFIPLTKTFSPSDTSRDVSYKSKTWSEDELSLLASVAIDSYADIANGLRSFSIPKAVTEAKRDYEQTIDPLKHWYADRERREATSLIGEEVESAYKDFVNFCKTERNMRDDTISSKAKFCRQLRSSLKLKTEGRKNNGKSVRVILKA